jgi:hypothetical protein
MENGAYLVQPEHEMSKESVDELWQHSEKVHARCSQCEWNEMGHQIAEEGFGICPSGFLECRKWLERYDLAFSGH